MTIETETVTSGERRASTPRRVIVLGCGPSGLVAAHAASVAGHNVMILSKILRPSQLYGCQYLHSPIPGVPSFRCARVRYHLMGTSEGYRHKVYGDDWYGKVSPEDFEGEHDAWDIRATYARLWSMYVGLIRGYEVNRGNLDTIRQTFTPDLIISTIPAPAICSDLGHNFRSHTIWANGSTEIAGDLKNEIICDGTGDTSWYRISDVFGYKTVEWPFSSGRPPAPGAVLVSKPLVTDCTCNPDVVRAGRYGEWKKSVLVHNVYDTVREAIRDTWT